MTSPTQPDEAITDLIGSCVFGKEWVELGFPKNFEAAKVNVNLLEKKIKALLAAEVQTARKEELIWGQGMVLKGRDVFLTKEQASPFSDDPMAEKAIKIRETLRKEINRDFEARLAQLSPIAGEDGKEEK